MAQRPEPLGNGGADGPVRTSEAAMNGDDQYTRWTDLDRMHDAQSVATYLDRATAQESVHAYKAQSFALLAPKAGAALLEVGCGTGMDVRALATMVAPGGRVVGVDRTRRCSRRLAARPTWQA